MSGTTTIRDVAPVDRSLRHVASGLPDASRLPRLKEMFGSDEPKRMSRRRRIAADAYQGTIRSAFVDGTSQPNLAFRVQCQSGLLEQVKPVPAISHAGTSDVATVMGEIAKSMGRTLENSGVNVKLSNVNLPGTAGQQAAALARHAGIQWTLDENVLAIWPANQPRQGDAVMVSPSTGLVGYPAFTSSGLILTTLFQGTLKYGVKVTVQSQLTPACGDWFVYRTEYQLDCMVPNGRWFAVIETGRIGPG